jgi:16S rRNA processing protein RimM
MLEVGRVVKPHGLRGEVIVELITDQLARVAEGSTLTSGSSDSLVVQASRPHQARWIVAFQGCTTREAADALRGEVLRAPALEEPNTDTLWVHRLIGSVVVRPDGTHCGTVDAVQANPAADLLVLDTGALVPATFVVEQRKDGVVVIDPPAGLLELADE